MNRTGNEDAPLFVGAFIHSLDSKKRVVLPAEWREASGQPQRLLAIPSPHGRCILVLPSSAVADRLENFADASLTESHAFQKIIGARSALLEWDSSGRVRIPDALLAHARIVREVRLVGAMSNFEIWNAADAAKRDAEAMPDALRTAMQKVGF